MLEMGAWRDLPWWTLTCLVAALGLLLGLLVGAAWASRRAKNSHADALARRQAEWQTASQSERELWRNQFTQLRSDHQALQAQANQWRELLDGTRDQRAQWQERAQRLPVLEEQLQQQTQLSRQAEDALARLQADYAALAAVHEEQTQQAAERLQFLERARETLQAQFQHLANGILEEKSQRFMQQNQQQLDQLLGPLQLRLQDFQGRVEQFYDAEGKQRAALSQQVHDLLGMNQRLSGEAQRLAQALTGSSKTQGNWGEALLARILEQAGMRAGQDYESQASFTSEDGRRLQPDIVIRLPQQRHLVIDSKVSLVAYERYVQLTAQTPPGGQQTPPNGDTPPDTNRELGSRAASQARSTAERMALRQHIESVRTHVRQLAARDYHKLHGTDGADFVVLFIPIEPALLLALREDERLSQDAWNSQVLLASPSTLLFVLRTVAHLWRQEAQGRNAREIARRGGELYDKLAAFVGELERLGQQLAGAQQAYQQAMHRLCGQRGNVLRQAEHLRDLGVQPSKALPAHLLDQARREGDDDNPVQTEPGERGSHQN